MSERSFYEITKARQEGIQEKLFRAHGGSAKLARELADAAHAHASEFLSRLPDAAETACEKGCSHCCHQPATVFPFEAVRIAQVLSATLSKEELEALMEKMRSRVRGLKGSSVAQSIEDKTACPLLTAGGECSIYSDRPLTCRLAHSFSVKRCRLAFRKSRAKTEIPVSLELMQGISGIIEAAFDQLPKLFKLDGNLYELCSAVVRALENADAGLNWAKGQSGVFAGCIKDDT